MSPVTFRPVKLLGNKRRPMRVRFTIDQFADLWMEGRFAGRRVELIEGEVYEMPPQEEPHYSTISKTRRLLEKAFGDGYYVRTQATMRFPPASAPDPDIAVVEGDEDFWAGRGNPSMAFLVVEVSVSTISFDRNRKAAMYAKARILDYWVIDVVNRRVEVRRNPRRDKSAKRGWTYDPPVVYDETQTLEALSRPGVAIAVADMLPKLKA